MTDRRRARARRGLRRGLSVVLVGAAVALAATAVAPHRTQAQTGATSFVLAGQSPWITPGTEFVLRFRGGNVPAGAQVAITAHDEVQSRSAFDASVTGANLPATRDRRTFAYDELITDPATGDRLLAYPSNSLGPGVFPLEVDLRSANDDSLARFVTHVVVAPVGADGALTFGQPLNVAWVWPLRAEPGYVATGNNPATEAAVSPEGRLGRQAAQLAANVEVPLTLVPSPETLDAWSAYSPELAVGPAGIRSTIGRNQILAEPFVPLDLPSMGQGGLGELVNPELTRGASTLENFFGPQVVDTTTALPGPLDAESLRLLLNAGRRQLVIEGDALTPVDERFTPAHPYKMRAVEGDDSSAVTVVATDTGFEQFLRGDAPPALRAAHLLAGLAVVAREQPSIARGVAIANPANWDADGTFMNAVLAGLRANPLLRPVTVRELIAAVPVATVDGEADGAPVYRQLAGAPTAPPAPPVTPAQYAKGLENAAAVRGLVGPTDPAAIRAERALASSVSAEWSNPAGRAEARRLLAQISTSIDAYLGQVEVQERGTVTITSSKAEIPIGFKNTSADVITVHLKLASDRLLFPDGAERDVELAPGRTTTVRWAVETRGSGTAPVRMTVTTADGLPIPGAKNRIIEVRSTFVSGVGVFLTVGAIVFLAAWWGWDIHRRRKRRAREQHPAQRLTPTGQPA